MKAVQNLMRYLKWGLCVYLVGRRKKDCLPLDLDEKVRQSWANRSGFSNFSSLTLIQKQFSAISWGTICKNRKITLELYCKRDKDRQTRSLPGHSNSTTEPKSSAPHSQPIRCCTIWNHNGATWNWVDKTKTKPKQNQPGLIKASRFHDAGYQFSQSTQF